ncbi:TetR family transcriptional regulator [Actinoplanes sp. NBRC 103695]|uniref:TetR/AcrR family transcriptional regulator n=1 Tax=Actinoplanes sp. NBRC 103695 TaxID=3032202 RepID=UPI0024A3F42C|nr:TetR family transcriptional regulator [Actinoplanes sp. NBRC 103695]GLY92881.1 TetR family transcriptional regulator [Actinoplanes sp. NBRC 103695]
MARWEGGAAARLREAAMELYAERGFEQTTVAEIADRTGLTARTFFRHFADKREVLFAGSEALQEGMVTALRDAPPSATPMGAVGAALDASTVFLGRDHTHSRRRHAIISANPELLERELIKMATLAAALSAGLRERGVPEPDASLAAQAGIVVLQVTFERWVTSPAATDLRTEMSSNLERLQTVTTAQ